MIELRELRIGNYINITDINYNDVVTKIDATGHENSIETMLYSYVDAESIQGIPLTEEILLKCGFYDKKGYYFLRGFEIRFWDGVNVTYKGIELFEKDLRLHQLQNLYHSLTGKELEIEL